MAFNTTILQDKAKSGANTDITSLGGLTTALSIAQGGTGQTALSDLSGTGDISGWSSGDRVVITDSSASDAVKIIGPPAEIGIACSDEDSAITTTGNKATLLIPRGMRITEVKASVTAVETTNSVVVNVKYHATVPGSAATIFSSSSALAIATDAYSAATASFASSATYHVAAENSFIVVTVEATAPTDAKGLKVWLLGYWT